MIRIFTYLKLLHQITRVVKHLDLIPWPASQVPLPPYSLQDTNLSGVPNIPVYFCCFLPNQLKNVAITGLGITPLKTKYFNIFH